MKTGQLVSVLLFLPLLLPGCALTAEAGSQPAELSKIVFAVQ